MKTFGLTAFAASLLVAFAAQGGDDAALKKERAAFQGMWKIVTFEDPDGKKDDLVGSTLDFDKEGKNLTFTHGGETKKGTFKLNPAGKLKEIDITTDDNKTLEGIYQIEKSTLKICLSTGNDGRPSEIALKDGKKFVLITLERTK